METVNKKNILVELIVFIGVCIFVSGCVTTYPQKGMYPGAQPGFLMGKIPGAEPQLKKAKENILKGNISEAIVEYKALIESSRKPDPVILSEYAYALALAGFYDFALVNLDRARMANPDNIFTYFFAAQVFKLMGYFEDGLIAELWPKMLRGKAPRWIRIDAPNLIKKYKAKKFPPKIQDLSREFSNANLLLSQRCFFQAVNVFRKITKQSPEEYVFYVGYSISLEKIGAPKTAAGVLKKAKKYASKQKADYEMQQQIAIRIQELEYKVKVTPPVELKTAKSIGLKSASKHTMLFVGGGISNSGTDLRFKYGGFSSSFGEAGLDLGYNLGSNLMSIGGSFSINMPGRKTDFLLGCGINYTSSNFGLVFTIGATKPFSKEGTVREEYLFEMQIGEDVFIMRFLMGMSTFFGKR